MKENIKRDILIILKERPKIVIPTTINGVTIMIQIDVAEVIEEIYGLDKNFPNKKEKTLLTSR